MRKTEELIRGIMNPVLQNNVGKIASRIMTNNKELWRLGKFYIVPSPYNSGMDLIVCHDIVGTIGGSGRDVVQSRFKGNLEKFAKSKIDHRMKVCHKEHERLSAEADKYGLEWMQLRGHNVP